MAATSQFPSGMTTPAIAFPTATNDPKHQISKLLFSRFIDQGFLEQLANICIYQSDFAALNPSIKSNDAVRMMKKFINDVRKDTTAMKLETTVSIEMQQSVFKFVYQLLNVREQVGARLVTYDNIYSHFPNPNIIVRNMIENVCNSRLTNMDDFRRMFEDVSLQIQMYNELKCARGMMMNLDQFITDANDTNTNLITLLNTLKTTVSEAHNSLMNMPILNKVDHAVDCFIISDKASLEPIVDTYTQHLHDTYSFFKSGYPIIDTNIGGIESSTLHLISGPSNHAKSILMINMCYRVIKYNLLEFEPGDSILFVTLEDDIFKLLRRFLSIFGNIDSEAIKALMVRTSALFKKHNNTDISSNTGLNEEFKKIFTELLSESILRITNQKVRIIIKHSSENTFTSSDLTRIIDDNNVRGNKVKMAFVDYVDVMVPSALGGNYTENDYFAHGQIIHELRLAARNYGLPIISITQNTRESENSQQSMGNNLIGDSYKKVRYSDYIYMIRMRDDLDVMADQVKKDVTTDHSNVSFQDVTGTTANASTPFEIKITKAKEGKKNKVKFHIFCGKNLRIYDTIDELYAEMAENQKFTTSLRNHVELMGTANMVVPSTSQVNSAALI